MQAIIDSAGLGAIMSIHKRVVQAGGILSLVDISPHVREVISITQLNKVLNIEDSWFKSTVQKVTPSNTLLTRNVKRMAICDQAIIVKGMAICDTAFI